MNLLVAVQVYEDHCVARSSSVDMMRVEGLSVMDALTAERADMVLGAGDPLLPGWEVFGFRRHPLRPVFPQCGIIG